MNELSFMELANAVIEKNASANLPTVDIDISSELELTAGTAIITLRELRTDQMFSIEADAKKIRRDNPSWPPQMCESISLLGFAHVSPAPTGPTGVFYSQIAHNNPRVFTKILIAYRRAFPSGSSIGNEDDEVKNALADRSE